MAAKQTKKTAKIWKVMELPVAGGPLYVAYKLRYPGKPDENGNRITHGGLWTTKKEAQLVADQLNKEAE